MLLAFAPFLKPKLPDPCGEFRGGLWPGGAKALLSLEMGGAFFFGSR